MNESKVWHYIWLHNFLVTVIFAKYLTHTKYYEIHYKYTKNYTTEILWLWLRFSESASVWKLNKK